MRLRAGFSYAVTTAHDGCLHLEVTVTGKQAHAAMPETGVDALEAATGILAALYASRSELAKLRFKRAGYHLADAQCRADQGRHQYQCGAGPGQHSVSTVALSRKKYRSKVEADLRALIARATARFPGISTEVRRILLAAPLVPQPGWEQIAELIRRHARAVLGIDAPLTGVPLYTDARHYAARGIPIVLYGAGPRTLLEANAHNANENLRLNDLRAATKIVARAIADLCSSPG